MRKACFNLKPDDGAAPRLPAAPPAPGNKEASIDAAEIFAEKTEASDSLDGIDAGFLLGSSGDREGELR